MSSRLQLVLIIATPIMLVTLAASMIAKRLGDPATESMQMMAERTAIVIPHPAGRSRRALMQMDYSEDKWSRGEVLGVDRIGTSSLNIVRVRYDQDGLVPAITAETNVTTGSMVQLWIFHPDVMGSNQNVFVALPE